MATGNSQISMALSYRISPQHVSKIVRDVMTSICDTMGPIYLPPPTTAQWETNEEIFRNIWNFPNASGAMDGKHVRIRCPTFSGSTHYNYKNGWYQDPLNVLSCWTNLSVRAFPSSCLGIDYQLLMADSLHYTAWALWEKKKKKWWRSTKRCGPSGSTLFQPGNRSLRPANRSPEYESEVRFIPSYWLAGGLGPPTCHCSG